MPIVFSQPRYPILNRTNITIPRITTTTLPYNRTLVNRTLVVTTTTIPTEKAIFNIPITYIIIVLVTVGVVIGMILFLRWY